MNKKRVKHTISDGQKAFLSKQNANSWSKQTGIPYASVYEFLNGKSFLSVQHLMKICDAAGIKMDDFLKL